MKKKSGIIYLIIFYALFYAPILVSILFSFNESNSMAVFSGFSFKWYKDLLTNDEALSALGNSLILAVISSVCATVLGTAAAIGIFNMRNKYLKNAVMTVTNLPMMNPDIVTGVSIMLLFAFVIMLCRVSLLGFPAMLIAHITFNLPYVILCILPKLKQMDKNLPEAAMDLGYTPLGAFFKVELFEILPGILSGMLLAFTLSLDDFVISYFVSGNTFQTLPLYIYAKTKRRVSPDMNALFAIIFAVIAALIILSTLIRNNSSTKKTAKTSKIITSVLAILLVCATIASCFFIVRGGTDKSDFEVTEETAAIDYSKYAGTTINVFNWGEYISDGTDGSVDINEEFTRLTGIKVNYTNFSSNEDMYAKIVNSGLSYDIIIPSDYMVDRLIKENRVQKLNFENIPNYKYISEEYKGLFFDKDNEYTVAYTGGTVGIIYNTTMIDYVPDSWDVLCDPELTGNILMFNNSRDAFGIAQFMNGIDINSTDKADWDKALEWLKDQKQYVKSYVMDEIFNKMESGSAAVAPYYAGDYLTMVENNEDLAFAYPKEGTNFFVDCMCIPENASNKEAAELYINFLLDPNVALENALYIYYASPLDCVKNNPDYIEEMGEEGWAITYPDAAELYPDHEYEDLFFHNLDEDTLAVISDNWSELKIASSDESGLSWFYIVTIVLLVIIVAWFVFLYVLKKRRRYVRTQGKKQ